MADETATTSGEEHGASPPKVSKVKGISGKVKKAAPKLVAKKVEHLKKAYGKGKKAALNLVVNQNATKHALLTDKTTTTSGEEHVASPPKVSKVKEISGKAKNCTLTGC